jgi:hypothetical protein
MKLTKILFVIGCLGFVSAAAQPDFTLPSLRRTYQSTYVNPAFMPKYKYSIGLPVVSNFYINQTRRGFTLKDVTESITDSGIVDLNTFYNKIEGDAIAVSTTVNTDIFHLSFPIGKFQIGFNSTLKAQTNQAISKDFIGFMTSGNSYFKGQTLDFKAFEISSFNYLENGLSVARKFGKLSLGVRVKYLQGIAVVQTQDLRFGIYTPESPLDPLVVKSGGTINTAGLPLFTDSVEGMESSESTSLKDFDAAYLYSASNRGFAFDFGFTYEVLPFLTVHGSVVDLGGITWRGTPYNYKLQNSDVQFDGLNDAQLKSGEAQQAFTDSLLDVLGKPTVSTNSFTTKLNARYTAGADINVTKRDVVGFLFQGQQTINAFLPAYTFSYTHRFGRGWEISSNYSIYNKQYANIGVGTAMKFGPVQWYIMTDDIMLFISPDTRNNLYFRTGINLVFGDVGRIAAKEEKAKKDKEIANKKKGKKK